MSSTWFWRNWPTSVRYPYLLLLGMAILTIAWSIYEYFFGPGRALPWLTDPFFDSLPITLDSFSRVNQTLEVQAAGYLLSERYQMGLPVLTPWVTVVYLALITLASVFYISAISTLKRLPFAIGMLPFMLLLVSFNTDALGLIKETRSYFLIILLVCYGALAYYFQSFALTANFTKRVLAFTALTIAVAALVYGLSGYNSSATTLHLAGHSAAAVMGGGLLFMLLAAFDNVQGLLWLNGQGTTPQQRAGLGRFLFVGLLYLLTLLFIYLASTGYFQVDVSFITPFFLLVISFCIGLWGLRYRESIMQRWLPFMPAGAFLYLSLAIFAFAAPAYAFATANDPVIEAFNDGVLYTHLAFGALFFIYVLANFGPLLYDKLPVYKVVYQPQRVPFFMVYTGGAILLLALVMYTGMYTVHQAQAGYYNYLGDLYEHEGDDLLAERYFAEGNAYENNNLRSNLNLAALADKKQYYSSEIVFLKRTLLKRPQTKMYVRLANLYADKEDLFNALFTLREGLKKFPESVELHNNLALLFAKTELTDSMAFYIDRARALHDLPLLLNNSLALLVQKGLTNQAHALAQKHTNHQYAPLQSNMLLLQLLEQPGKSEKAPKRITVPEIYITKLTDGTFGVLYHQILELLPHADSAWAGKLAKLSKVPGNETYSENLQSLQAMVLHYHADRTEARKLLEQLALNSQSNAGYYHDLLGLWLLQEDAPAAAADYFAKAKSAGYMPAYMHQPVALALAQQPAQAINEARTVLMTQQPELTRQVVKLLNLLETSPNVLATSTDSARAFLLQAYTDQLPIEVHTSLAQSLAAPAFKTQALTDAAYRLLQAQKPVEAEALWQQLQAPELKTALGAGANNRLQAELWLAQKRYDHLLKTIPGTDFGFGYIQEKQYYLAMANWRLGKTQKAAQYFNKLPALLPYHQAAILATAQFYQQAQNQPAKAYNVLLGAIAYNPYAPDVLKAYILSALQNNLGSYAQYGLQRLAGLVSTQDYTTFKALYNQKEAETSALNNSW